FENPIHQVEAHVPKPESRLMFRETAPFSERGSISVPNPTGNPKGLADRQDRYHRSVPQTSASFRIRPTIISRPDNISQSHQPRNLDNLHKLLPTLPKTTTFLGDARRSPRGFPVHNDS